MLDNAIICLNILKYLQDWEDRINLAMTSRATCLLVLHENQHVPPVYFDLRSNQKILQIQRLTANSLIVNMGSGKVESNLGNVIPIILELRNITINFVWSSSRIKYFCSLLVARQVPVNLYVPYENYPTCYRQVKKAQFITLKPFLLDYSQYESSSSSSSEEEKHAVKEPPRQKRMWPAPGFRNLYFGEHGLSFPSPTQ